MSMKSKIRQSSDMDLPCPSRVSCGTWHGEAEHQFDRSRATITRRTTSSLNLDLGYEETVLKELLSSSRHTNRYFARAKGYFP